MRLARLAVIPLLFLLIAAAPQDPEELKQQALSEDFNVSRVALKALVARGASARPILRDVVKELLARDKAKVSENAALLADAAKYRQADQKLAAQRKIALDNIAVLERDKTVKEAAENHHALQE